MNSIIILDSVTRIGDNAFANPFFGCTNTTIYANSEKTKQFLIDAGVSASKIIVRA